MNASIISETNEIEEVNPLRETVANFKAAEEQSEEKSRQYASFSLFSMNVKAPLVPYHYMKSIYKIDDEARYKLHQMEK